MAKSNGSISGPKTTEEHNDARRSAKARQSANRRARAINGKSVGDSDLFGAIRTDRQERRDSRPAPRPKPQPISDIGSHIFNKMGPHIVRQADKHGWSYDVRVAAIAYAKAITQGTGSVNAAADTLSKLDSHARRGVEKTFATTCWFNHRVVGDTELTGMSHTWYKKYYSEAMTRWPARQQASA